MHARAAELIEKLRLEPHPEGGFYKEIFRSSSRVMPADGRAERAALTTIYFLLTAGAVSRWHRVASDEAWHLYEGGPLEVFELDPPCGSLTRHQLAGVAGDAASPVCVIAGGHWQAARPLGDFALVGCTVGPGFEFADFEMLADAPDASAQVRETWPALAALI